MDTDEVILLAAVGVGAWLLLRNRQVSIANANASFSPQGNTAQSGGAGVPRTGAFSNRGGGSINPAISNWEGIVEGGPVGITKAYVGGVVEGLGAVFSGSAQPTPQSPEQAAAYLRTQSVETQQFVAEINDNRRRGVSVGNATTPFSKKFRNEFMQAVKLGSIHP